MTEPISAALTRIARDHPRRAALLYVRRRGAAFEKITFAQLEATVVRYANTLTRVGISPAMRTILMVRPGPDFFALTFALMRIGAVPVLIDPGMGKRHMARCLAGVQAEAFIGIPLAHLFRRLFPAAFRTVRIKLTVGRSGLSSKQSKRVPEILIAYPSRDREGAVRAMREHIEPLPYGRGSEMIASEHIRLTGLAREPEIGNDSLNTGHQAPGTSFPPAAAILFTTGSTGPPKGVVYRHETFHAQIAALRDHFGLAPGQIDLATFPLFALFNAALGVTAVIPRMDFTRPGFVNPRGIIDAIETTGCTNMFASPALLDRVGRYGVARRLKLSGLRRIITAGAPVRPDILERFAALLPDDATITTGYGATEALPVAAITHREILADTQHFTARGAGICVGRAVGDVKIRVIRISDEPIENGSSDLLLGPMRRFNNAVELAHLLPLHVGEIVVAGPVVTHDYFNNAAGTALAKIRDSETIWHRMGDVGYVDAKGRLWMCGRKSHRVETPCGPLFTECVEAIFNQHPAIRRSALIGMGERPNEQPILCVELNQTKPRRWPGRAPRLSGQLMLDLREMAAASPMTAQIDTFLVHRRFPVDIRHNAKIFREKLRIWAENRLP